MLTEPPSHHVPGPGERLPGLDGVRGLAILLVLLRHAVLFGGFEPATVIDRYLNVMAKASWVGVDLFFVLSGFLITGILFDTRSDRHYFRTFYVRRVLRIVPLYYAFLAVYFIVGYRLFPASTEPALTPRGLLWAASYLSNVPTALAHWSNLPHPVRHVWSLAIEEQFYLVWPVLIWKAPRRRLMAVCLALLPVAWAVRLGLLSAGYPVGGYVLTPARLGPLALGAFVALAARDGRDLRLLRRIAKATLVMMCLLLLGVLLVRRDLDYLDPITQLLGFDALALLFAGMIVLVITAGNADPVARASAFPPLRFLGKYSYSIYLSHQLIMLALAGAGLSSAVIPPFFGARWPGVLCFFTVGSGLSVALALLSWRAVEQPFLRLKTRFAYGRVSREAAR